MVVFITQTFLVLGGAFGQEGSGGGGGGGGGDIIICARNLQIILWGQT